MATRTATARAKAGFDATVSNLLDANDTGKARITHETQELIEIASGTLASMADRCWSDKGRTLTSGNDVQIDVFDFGGENVGAGDGMDPLGQDIELAEIVGILAVNDSSSDGDLVLGGDQGEANAADFNIPWNAVDGDAIIVKPGGFLLLVAPPDPAYAVADSTAHMLTCGASGGDITYDLHILGRSA